MVGGYFTCTLRPALLLCALAKSEMSHQMQQHCVLRNWKLSSFYSSHTHTHTHKIDRARMVTLSNYFTWNNWKLYKTRFDPPPPSHPHFFKTVVWGTECKQQKGLFLVLYSSMKCSSLWVGSGSQNLNTRNVFLFCYFQIKLSKTNTTKKKSKFLCSLVLKI